MPPKSFPGWPTRQPESAEARPEKRRKIDTDDKHSDAATRENIAEDGDTVLFLEQDKDHRVSSVFLKNSSKVFAAMLSGQYLEGTSLSADKPRRIDLPDDKYWPVFVICKAIHVQQEHLPLQVTIEELFDLAVIADGYDCKNVLRFLAMIWHEKFKAENEEKVFKRIKAGALTTSTTLATDLLYLSAATFLLNDAAGFRYVTRMLSSTKMCPLHVQVFLRFSNVAARVL